jgi:hypothetical protein
MTNLNMKKYSDEKLEICGHVCPAAKMKGLCLNFFQS